MTLSRWGSRRDHLVAELPSGDFRSIVLDVKTAFSDAASICQIGMTGVRPHNRIEAFATLVNLRMRFSPGPEQVAEAQDFHTACARISSLLSQHHLIQHGGFDKTAIHADCVSTAQDATDLTSGDSVKIARRAWLEFIGNGGHGLGHLEKQHGLSIEHHDAGEDAKAAVMVVRLRNRGWR